MRGAHGSQSGRTRTSTLPRPAPGRRRLPPPRARARPPAGTRGGTREGARGGKSDWAHRNLPAAPQTAFDPYRGTVAPVDRGVDEAGRPTGAPAPPSVERSGLKGRG